MIVNYSFTVDRIFLLDSFKNELAINESRELLLIIENCGSKHPQSIKKSLCNEKKYQLNFYRKEFILKNGNGARPTKICNALNFKQDELYIEFIF